MPSSSQAQSFCMDSISSAGALPTRLSHVNMLWYKIYTCTIMAFMVVLFILACLETRKAPCGQFTTYPRDLITDFSLCPSGQPVAADLPTGSFGLVEHVVINANGTINKTSTDGSVMKPVIIEFTGLCFGDFPNIPGPETVLESLNDTFIVPSL